MLTDALRRAARVGGAVSTERSHRSHWNTYQRFCEDLGLDPAEPYTKETAEWFCAWFNVINKQGETMNTSWLQYHYYIARESAGRHGTEMRWNTREHKQISKKNNNFTFCNKRPFRRVAPLTRPIVLRVAAVLDDTQLKQVQAYAAIIFAFVGFLRPSEFLGDRDDTDYAPRFRDLQLFDSQLVYYLDKWKWSAERSSALITFPRGVRPELDVALWLDRLCLAVRGASLQRCIAELPRQRVFVRLVAGLPTSRPLSRWVFTAQLRNALTKAGVSHVDLYTGGSMRRGAVTQGLADKVDKQVMRQQLCWAPGTNLFNTYATPTGSMRREALIRLAGGR